MFRKINALIYQVNWLSCFPQDVSASGSPSSAENGHELEADTVRIIIKNKFIVKIELNRCSIAVLLSFRLEATFLLM